MIDRNKIREVVTRMQFPPGIGDAENACSIGALNIALYGKLTDKTPDCASDVICEWVRLVQDVMPDNLRNSARWKEAVINIPGTGKAHEDERLAIVLDHMWSVTLPTMQPLADAKGFGDVWRRMTRDRTPGAALEAAWAARQAWEVAAADAAERAARAEAAAAEAAERAEAAARAAAEERAARAACAACAAAERAEAAARAAAEAAEAAAEAGEAEAEAPAALSPDFWDRIDPCAVLERLNAVHQGDV
jgi:hypothetical protein